jgi:hypothetical protein
MAATPSRPAARPVAAKVVKPAVPAFRPVIPVDAPRPIEAPLPEGARTVRVSKGDQPAHSTLNPLQR